MTIQQTITYLEHNAYIIGEVTDACVEALKKQAGIERVLGRLEERKKNSLKSCETMSDSIIYRDAIEIIKEEVG